MWVIAAWAAAGALLAFLDRPLWDAVWVGMLGIWAAYAFIGLLVALWSGLRALRLRTRAAIGVALVAPAWGVVLWLLAPHVAAAGDSWQFHRRFARLRPEYMHIVRVVAESPPSLGAHQDAMRAESVGVSYLLDPGPPTRVAFPQPRGIIDNWEGVVYDPSDRVRTATGWKKGVPGSFSASPDVVKSFGGDLIECESLGAHFYRCWFT